MVNVHTSQPRKQRLQRYNAPQHVARKQISSHLSEELLLKYERRSLTVIVGDEVKVMRGGNKGKTGKVLEVFVPDRKVVVEGVTHKKADGTEVPLPVDPSNLVIQKLNLEDKRRKAKLEATEEDVKMGRTDKPAKGARAKPAKPSAKPAPKPAAAKKTEPAKKEA